MAESLERSAIVHHMAITIRHLFWLGHKQSAATMELVGLTLPQAVVLFSLEAGGGQSTMTELVRVSQQSAGTLTGVVDRLIGAGLVERDRDDADRRVVVVALTEAGRAKIGEINDRREADITRMTAEFSSAELAQFADLLGRLLVGIEAIQG